MKWGRLQRMIVIVSVMFILLFAGCGDTNQSGSKAEAEFANTYSDTDTWLVYWYICGADLESESEAATDDLKELMQVKLPSNVKVLIETGGARSWHTPGISANAIGRYLYDSEGLHTLDQLPDADMGEAATVTDFLRFGRDNYPADHRVVVFWDHGGGSAAGLCLDERTGNMLSLDELREGISQAYPADEKQPPFELIGFDACLMATVDVMQELHGLGHYMTASEELEPGNGWNYTGWVGALARNPGMNGAGLGKNICDTYLSDCEKYGTDGQATLSVVDISRLPELRSAYEAFGTEALRAARKAPEQFFSSLARQADTAENYGGNTRDQGYTNMVDLSSLAAKARGLLPSSSEKLVAAIDNAVLYRVNGPYRQESHGLSAYYSYDGDEEGLQAYVSLQGASMPFKCLYYYLVYGEMPQEAEPYLNGQTPAEPAQSGTSSAIPKPQGAQKIFSVQALEDTEVDVDADGYAFVRLTPEQTDRLAAVHCQLAYYSTRDDIILYLGSDADIDADWDKGLFKDNFQGRWPMLDGHPVYIEVTHEGDGYNLYSVPVRLNGVECNLQVVYNYHEEKYRILGARKGLETNGIANRQLIHLKAGDQITTLHYAMTMSGSDEEFTQVDMETFTIGEHPEVKDEELGDGNYGYYFEFIDPLNESALSKLVKYDIKNGEITTTVGEELNESSAQPSGSIAATITGGDVE